MSKPLVRNVFTSHSVPALVGAALVRARSGRSDILFASDRDLLFVESDLARTMALDALWPRLVATGPSEILGDLIDHALDEAKSEGIAWTPWLDALHSHVVAQWKESPESPVHRFTPNIEVAAASLRALPAAQVIEALSGLSADLLWSESLSSSTAVSEQDFVRLQREPSASRYVRHLLKSPASRLAAVEVATSCLVQKTATYRHFSLESKEDVVDSVARSGGVANCCQIRHFLYTNALK